MRRSLAADMILYLTGSSWDQEEGSTERDRREAAAAVDVVKLFVGRFLKCFLYG